MRRFSALLIALAAISAAQYSCSRKLFSPKKTETIHIISTNDMHGAINRFPNLAALVGEYRAQDTASVFLIDAGDRWTGNVYVDMAPEPGKPVVELMNMLRYDVATFGNHEFDKGLAHLDKRTREFTFPVVLANIDTGDTPLAQPEPYVVLTTMGGRKIAVLGLISNFSDGHPDGKDEIFEGTYFPSPFDAAREYMWLDNGNDIFVGLTHVGDLADSVLAVTVPAIDLIIGGHSHTVMTSPRVYGDTYVTQAGSNLEYAGITAITINGDKITAIENRLVRLDTIAPDPVYAELVNKYYANEEFKRPIGSFAGDADKNGVANLVTDLIRRELETDFGLYHIGGLRADSFAAGDVSIADMLGLEPFASKAVKVSMTLPQIRELIVNKFNDVQNPRESHRVDIYPSGMNYAIITDERGEAVDVIFDNGYPYDSGTVYSVAMSDYMYGKYKFEKPAVERESPLVTDILISYFRASSPVEPDNKPRVSIMRN